MSTTLHRQRAKQTGQKDERRSGLITNGSGSEYHTLVTQAALK